MWWMISAGFQIIFFALVYGEPKNKRERRVEGSHKEGDVYDIRNAAVLAAVMLRTKVSSSKRDLSSHLLLLFPVHSQRQDCRV